ncbi:MAG: hypothetical protein RLZZ148_163, partial [Cyanobacteriota bacterium]
MIELLPLEVSRRVAISCLAVNEPIQVVMEASRDVDLTIAGTSRTWGVEKQTLGFYT